MARGVAKHARKAVNATRSPEDEAALIVVGGRCMTKRNEMELSRLSVASEAGIDPSSLYRFEMGKQALSIPKLARVAKVLGITLDELVAP